MILSIISAIAKNNEIGQKNALLWSMPADLKHFKEITSGHPVIMGQKTFESLGQSPTGELGRPLPNRRNIVLTKDEDFKRQGIEIVYSLEELGELLKKTTREDEEVFIIGGGQIYKLFIEKADKLYITHVDAIFPEADTYFPTIDLDVWQKISEEKYLADEKNEYPYSFVIYQRKII
jgi:dihydrofolate reductase